MAVERTVVVGGPAAIGQAVLDDLPDPVRLAGADRYGTSVAVAALGLQRGHLLDEVYLATGHDFPDALAAGPVAAAGEWGAPAGGLVLLVDGRDAAGSPTALEFLRDHAGQIERTLLLGGADAISAEVEAAIRAAVS